MNVVHVCDFKNVLFNMLYYTVSENMPHALVLIYPRILVTPSPKRGRLYLGNMMLERVIKRQTMLLGS